MEELSNKHIQHLKLFNEGLIVENCIDLCSELHGRLLPNLPIGKVLKVADLRALKVRGLIKTLVVEYFGVKHLQYSISDYGSEVFKGYENV